MGRRLYAGALRGAAFRLGATTASLMYKQARTPWCRSIRGRRWKCGPSKVVFCRDPLRAVVLYVAPISFSATSDIKRVER
jgi:hypothetical protein